MQPVVRVLICVLLSFTVTGTTGNTQWAAAGLINEKMRKVQTGVWGGKHLLMEVSKTGATLTYDCADGTIDRPIKIDGNGRFKAQGTHTRQRAGAIRSDEKPDLHPAQYSGRVAGKRLTLTVRLTDTRELIGTFSLTFGEVPELTRCL